MSDYKHIDNSSRNKTLIVVEGDLEKNSILKTILLCFPEIPVKYEDIQIFSSDVYDLYHSIEMEYGEEWFEDELSIDLPYLISRRLKIEPHLDRRNYTNIILMFDYEHHDVWYSDEKIMKMQKHFNNASEDGLLYINYPMIESLFHFNKIPDEDYCSRLISVKCKPGRKYKNLVKTESEIQKYLMLFNEMAACLKKRTSLDEQSIGLYVEKLLSIKSISEVELVVEMISSETGLSKCEVVNLKYTLEAKLKKCSFIQRSITYWDDLKNLILYIAKENIKKAYMIQNIGKKR